MTVPPPPEGVCATKWLNLGTHGVRVRLTETSVQSAFLSSVSSSPLNASIILLLIEGVRLICGPLNTGFTAILIWLAQIFKQPPSQDLSGRAWERDPFQRASRGFVINTIPILFKTVFELRCEIKSEDDLF